MKAFSSFFAFNKRKAGLFIFATLLSYLIPKTSEICSMGDGGVACNQEPISGFGLPIFFGESFSGDAITVGFYPLEFAQNILIYYPLVCLLFFICSPKKQCRKTKTKN